MQPAKTATLITDRLRAAIVPGRGENGGYSLVIDGVTQSHVNPDDPLDLQLDYVRAVAALIDAAFPVTGPIAALHLGGGALTVPRYLAATRPGSPQRVVELFGELLEFVLDNLPLASGSDVELIVADARDAVMQHATSDAGRWDLVVVDVFSGSAMPLHVSTLEFYSVLKSSLNTDGVLLVNTLTSRGLSFTQSAIATLTAVFPHVVAVAAASALSGERAGNVVLAASNRPLDLPGLADHAARWPHPALVLDEAGLRAHAVAGTVSHDPDAVVATELGLTTAAAG